MEFPVWIVLAGLPSLLYAISNHIDKHLLETHFSNRLGPISLLVVSALISVVALPFIWIWSPTSLAPEIWSHLFLFALVGLLHTALLWCYLTALSLEDTTTIVIFYAMLPILGLAASNLLLGESLLPMQVVAMFVTILAILLISVERTGDTLRVKTRAAALMFGASLCWALGDVAFKFVALEESLHRALFWEHLILFCVGCIVLLIAPTVRQDLVSVTKQNTVKILSINLTSECLYILGNVVSAIPLLLVQVAAVHLVQTLQPVWVFLIGVLLWKVGYAEERMTMAQLLQKSIATLMAVAGMFLLTFYTPS